jgi:hypothetical protein
MKIQVTQLRKAAEILLNHLSENGTDEIELTKDFYWSIPPEQRYNPYVQPAQLTLGQLSEDWKEILRVANAEEEPTEYHLEWLSAILRYIADHT